MIKIGKLLKDDSVYVGDHPFYTNCFLLCKAQDEPKLMKWQEAFNYHSDSGELPTRQESNTLYQHRKQIGGFLEGYLTTYDYWYSVEDTKFTAWKQCFLSGKHSIDNKDQTCHVRLVRTVTPEQLEVLV